MRIKISDGTESILDYEEPDDPRLAKVDKHKKDILDVLRNEYERGAKSKPFDGDKAWRHIIGLAGSYFRPGSVKKEIVPAAEQVKRLRKLEEVLGKARTLIDEALQDEVGGALHSSWCEANAYFGKEPEGEPALTPVHFKVFDPIRTKNEFDKVFLGLATLEAAASHAADNVPAAKRGRPAILSRDEIWNLAALYRDSTGSIPGGGDGPFASFVVEVLTAQGRYNALEDQGKRVRGAIKYQSVVDAIVDTRQWALTDPVARKWAPSPFEEEE